MPFSITFTNRANDDLREIIDYYDHEAAEVTQSFLREFIAIVDLLREHPNACPIAFAKVRKKVMHRFPFNIFYTIRKQKKEVVIARIWHQKRNPKALSLK
ncbi:MAG: type II toxin-antitoxin system RelE/ParE family toxin [Saprospiraceae bacterium]|nr:type II toxin-antitoxin system RelE/ParE family toxin [Saprospiraceae bacterium]MCF8249587.1 type II toxin-antitoxin system RelE/ParE family toxin [Saprospiraceae bacterium]MCF8280487.1 type II toxin-antitoxin system RelE/ParE family toxin [Bacteroidales bacterium]MCF8310419.1 type II toxin-antitoxin system RelE/ParE family toxin [Saprospiraceae bacterium]MCF8439797.1 type II toxin-antitoxin system RelE/ParE family toxin [Saprospiraceae bacterium]